MITIKQEEMYDLNKIGLWVTVFIALLLLLYSINLLYLMLLELFLIGYGAYLYLTIKRYKNTSIMVNSEEKWFIEWNGTTIPAQLKDYWFLKQYLFIWVKGKENSVSFVVTRSIIGEQKFSQLRALIN